MRTKRGQQVEELRDLRSLVDSIDYLANRARGLTSIEAYEAIRRLLADYREGRTERAS